MFDKQYSKYTVQQYRWPNYIEVPLLHIIMEMPRLSQGCHESYNVVTWLQCMVATSPCAVLLLAVFFFGGGGGEYSLIFAPLQF